MRTLYRLAVTADKASAAASSRAHPAPTVRVGLLGCGNVGAALAEILLTRAEDVAARTGIRLELVGIAVADPERERPIAIPAGLLGAMPPPWWRGPTSTSSWRSSVASTPPTS